jgi:hypothetical protein
MGAGVGGTQLEDRSATYREIVAAPTRRVRLCKTCKRQVDPWGRCRRRTCKGYFRLWAGDVAAYLMENMLLGIGAEADLITITPPGAARLPWDRTRCSHPADVKCSGEHGCRVDAGALAEWHADFAPRLDRLLRAARERLRRRGHKMPRYVVSLEPQRRGGLHVHMATPVPERTAAHELFKALRELAPRHGFGGGRFGVKWDPWRGEGSGAGAYLSKLARYVSKEAAGDGAALREVLEAVPGRRVFRASVKLTRETRCTMRNLRRRRFLFVRYGLRGLDCRNVELTFAQKRAEEDARQRIIAAHRIAEAHRAALPPPWSSAWRRRST